MTQLLVKFPDFWKTVGDKAVDQNNQNFVESGVMGGGVRPFKPKCKWKVMVNLYNVIFHMTITMLVQNFKYYIIIL